MARWIDVIPTRLIGATSALVLIALFGCGCSSGKRIAAANDQLRQKNHELEQQVLALKRENEALNIQLEAESQRPDSLSPETQKAIPHVVEISLGRLTHVSDNDGDGQPDTLLAYLQAVDDRGRFTQAVGDLTITVANAPDEGDANTIGRLSVSPAQLRDAYRSAFTGQHYTIEVPLSQAVKDASLLVRASYVDALSGRELIAERTLKVN